MRLRTYIALALSCGLIAPAMAANPACERKAAQIEQQIQHAKAAGNTHRVSGLEKALSQARTNCTDAGLIAEQRADIAEQQEDIDEILEDIQEKQAEGRSDKVEKLERKLGHEKKELEVLQHELRQLEMK